MALSHSPSIITNGLTFYYDMGNTQKSWKGAPTTNIANPNLNGMQSIVVTYVGLDNGWKKYSLSGTWNSGTYPFSMAISGSTFTGGVAYSTQIKMKTNVRHKFLTFNDIFYVNDPNMTFGGNGSSTTIGREDGLEIILNKREGFIYSTGFANPTTTQAGYIGSRPVSDGTVFNSSTDFVWIKDVQVEEGTFCTPYVESSRSNAQAILDLTNRNTVTASSLAYNSNNTFSFNGTNSGIIGSQTAAQMGITTDLTISIFTNRSSSPTNALQGQAGFGTGGSISIKNSGNYFADINSTTLTRYIVNISTDGTMTPYENNWANLCVTVSGTTIRTYLNGVLKNTQVMDSTIKSFGAELFGIGNGYGYFRMQGSVSLAKVYNRALTQDEVRQNFNALRGRYGI